MKINSATDAFMAFMINQGTKAFQNSLAKLSSGSRINKAADDAAGMAIADSLQSQLSGFGQAIRNASDAISIAQVADGALEQSTSILQEIRVKALQAANGSQSVESRQAIQADIDRLQGTLGDIAKNTSFNGQKLLSGSFTDKQFQVGANAGETVTMNIGSAEPNKIGQLQPSLAQDYTTTSAITTGEGTALAAGSVLAEGSTLKAGTTLTNDIKAQGGETIEAGTTLEEDVTIEGNQMLSEGMALAAGSELAAGTLIAKGSQVPEATADQAEGLRTVTGSVSDINVLSQQGATDALSIVDEALNQINTMRSEIGSTQNQLSSTIANLSVNEVNTAAAQSQIRDIDFAEEVMNLNKLQVLTQARLFAMSQGSKVNQSRIMNLLQG